MIHIFKSRYWKIVLVYLLYLPIRLCKYTFWSFIYFIKYWINRWKCFFLRIYSDCSLLFSKSRTFVKKRYKNWVKWNFKEHWSIFRIFFFIFTTLSLIKPIYFICRWLGYVNYIFWNIIFIIWRSFFFELFTYLFDWTIWAPTIEDDSACTIRNVWIGFYLHYASFANKICFFFTSCFFLCYIDYFFAYLDSLRYRNWVNWLLKRLEILPNTLDDIIILSRELYEWSHWYYIEVMYWVPTWRRQFWKAFWKKEFHFRLYLFEKKWALKKKIMWWILIFLWYFKKKKEIWKRKLYKYSYKFFYRLKNIIKVYIPLYSLYIFYWLKNNFFYYSACFFGLFWNIAMWFLKWTKLRTWFLLKRKISLLLFTRYARRLYKYQIKIYFFLVKSIFEIIIWYVRCFFTYWFLKLRYIFGTYLYNWLVVIFFFFLFTICIILDIIFDIIMWIMTTRLFNFFWRFIDSFLYFFKSIIVTLIIFFKKYIRSLLLFLKKLPIFSRILKYYNPELDDNLIREYLYLILLFWRKHTYKIPEEAFNNTYIEIKKESAKDAYISQYLLLMKERWEAEGEIPDDELEMIFMIKDELERDELRRIEIQASIRDFKPKKDFLKKKEEKRKNDERREKLVNALKDYLKQK